MQFISTILSIKIKQSEVGDHHSINRSKTTLVW